MDVESSQHGPLKNPNSVLKSRKTYGRSKAVAIPTDASSDESTKPSTALSRWGNAGLLTEPENGASYSHRDPGSDEQSEDEDIFSIHKSMAAIDRKFAADEEEDQSMSKLKGDSYVKGARFEEDVGKVKSTLGTFFEDIPSPHRVTPPPPTLPTPKPISRHSVDRGDNSVTDGISSSENSSPSRSLLHPMSTPPSRSSATPPTSVDNSLLLGSKVVNIHDVEMEDLPKPRKGKKDSISGKKKSKSLSKKELKEAQRNQARIYADQPVEVRKAKQEPLPVSAFLLKFNNPTEPAATSSSDPIQEYTSPNKLYTEHVVEKEITIPASTSGDRSRHDSDDEEMPDLSTMIQEDSERRKRKDLVLIKQRAMEQTEKAHQSPSDEEEDDLIIERKDRSTRLNPSSILAQDVKPSRLGPQLAIGSKQHQYIPRFREVIKKSLKPSATQDSHKGLFGSLLGLVDAQSQGLRKQKEEEWLNRGGKLKSNVEELQAGEETELDLSLKQFLEARADSSPEEPEDEDEDEDDPEDDDWVQERGSASPKSPFRENEGSDVRQHSGGDDDSDKENAEVDDETDNEEPHIPTRLKISKSSRVVNSDSEEEPDDGDKENAPLSIARVLVPDTSGILEVHPSTRKVPSLLSSRGSSINEEDKENNSRLMYDEDADKENVAVPRHIPLGRPALGIRHSSGLFGLSEGFQRSLSVSSGEDTGIDSDIPKGSVPVLSYDPEDPFALSAPLQASSRQIPKKSPSPQPLQPAFGDSSASYSQFFGDETQVPRKDRVAITISQANGCTGSSMSASQSSPKLLNIGGMSQLFSSQEESDFLGKQRTNNEKELSLTLDTGLQPALEITTQVRRQAAAIFEQEQNYLIEEASKNRRAEPEVYVLDNGMLTQTRPSDQTPVVYRAVPATQDSVTSTSQSQRLLSQRQPLGTLSFTSTLSSPSKDQPLRRISKGLRRLFPSPSPSAVSVHAFNDENRPILGDAFSIMMQGASKKAKSKKVMKSEYVEGEAQESDDDDMLGFGGRKQDDDEDSGDEDDDGQIDGLVDDAAMDDDVLAADKVKEKHQEAQDIEDQNMHKIVTDVVGGKKRTRRRNGATTLDDSDSEGEEEENARRRSKMYKRARTGDGHLAALEKDEKSAAFVNGYKHDLQDPAEHDFAHLMADDMSEESDEDDEDENRPVRQKISIAQVREKLMQMAESNENPDFFNPDDTNWVEKHENNSDEELVVREVEHHLKKPLPTKKAATSQGDLDTDIQLSTRARSNREQEQLSAWAREQKSSYYAGGGRSKAGAAVTGHTIKSSRTESSSATQTRVQKTERRKPAKSASLLASVADKHSCFGN